MIQANELRIGNYVTLLGELIKVTPKLILEQYQSDIAKHDYLQPIPLTEDWLFKFGFEENIKTNVFYRKFPLELFYGPNGFEYFHAQLTGKFITIKHVHQLQNLYFALTGQELTLKS